MRSRSVIGYLVALIAPLALLANTAEGPYDDIAVYEEKEELSNINEIKDFDLSHLETRSYSGTTVKRKHHSYSKHYRKKEEERQRGGWKPFFLDLDRTYPPKNFFFRTDIGIGFLYFKKVRGNLQGDPSPVYNQQGLNAPYRNRLMYNKTPLYEYQLGYQFNPYLKTSFAYVHQGNVTVETKKIPVTPVAGQGITTMYAQFSSNVNLDALIARVYTQFPYPLMFRNIMTTLYIGTGGGFGWQSWANNWLNTTIAANTYTNDTATVRQKTSMSIVWMSDLGIRMQRGSPESQFSMQAGVKFNYWGQSRNVGKLSQQGTSKYALFRPLTVKAVYQWSPYVGVQWNVPPNIQLSTKDLLRRSHSPMFTQVNVGPGFLFFKKIQGNLLASPNFNGTGGTGWQSGWVSQKVRYNRTPLFEYLVMHSFTDFFQFGISYQNQGGINVETQAVNAIPGTGMQAAYMTLLSYLNLNAVMFKGYLKYCVLPNSKKIRLYPYAGVGVGGGWQTWSRTFVSRVAYVAVLGSQDSTMQPLHQKIVGNVVINIDFGLQSMILNNQSDFSLLAGCKYNYWGQVRNIGKQSQQGNYPLAINRPFRAKKLYQWAPYLGVQWNFPMFPTPNKNYYLDGQSPCTWVPYFIKSGIMDLKRGMLTEFSVGIGTLRFIKTRGYLSASPSAQFVGYARDVPLKGRLAHNDTPVFEYFVGYSVFRMLKAGVSYQHQGNITIQSDLLHTFTANSAAFTNMRAQFTSDLVLDSLMVKVYFASPVSLVWRSVVFNPYFAAATGAVWQTWKNVSVNYLFVGGAGIGTSVQSSFNLGLRQKVSSSMGVMLDAGLKMQPPFPGTSFSVMFGTKLNIWGTTYNVGKLSSQLTPRYGLKKPFEIKTIYQWAPYVGVQWKF